jgi:hypothetical protein
MTEIKKEVKATPESTKVERPRERKKGVFNGTQGKLQVGGTVPGYHLHIFNDTPGRITAAQENGYEFVSPDEVGGTTENVTSRNTDIGEKVRFLVGAGEKGEPMYAYLMKIKEEWWIEDQAQLQERNDKTDAAIRQGKTPGVDSAGFYNAGIKY